MHLRLNLMMQICKRVLLALKVMVQKSKFLSYYSAIFYRGNVRVMAVQWPKNGWQQEKICALGGYL